MYSGQDPMHQSSIKSKAKVIYFSIELTVNKVEDRVTVFKSKLNPPRWKFPDYNAITKSKFKLQAAVQNNLQ